MKRRHRKPAGNYCKVQLDELIDRVKCNDTDAIQEAVIFCLAESRGIWHGRARAKICRNLKSLDIPRDLQDCLVQTIGNRLVNGNFSEQFNDQLTMAIRFRPEEMRACAERALGSNKEYIRRYAQSVINKLDAQLPRKTRLLKHQR